LAKSTDTNVKTPTGLRGRAEAAWRARHRDLSATSSGELARLVHDLEVHEIELEIQNEELRRAQSELEESRQQFSDLYDFAPVGYLTIDLSSVITQANLACAGMLGVARGRLVGQRFTRFLSPGSQHAFLLAIRDADANTDAVTRCPHLVLKRKNGAELPVSMEIVGAVEPGRRRVLRCVLIDITPRQAAERALRASEERYRGLAEQVVDGIFVADSRGQFVDANRAGCEMLGYTLEELKTLTIQDVVAPEARPRLPEQFRRLANGAITHDEWRLMRKDRSTFDGELVARQLPDGRLQGVVRDLTDQKRSAQALQRRLAFETLLFELSRTFIGLPDEEVDVNMERGLERVGTFLEMDRVTLLELSRDRSELSVAYAWSAPGVPSVSRVLDRRTMPWWISRVLHGEVSLASHVDDLPEEAALEKEYLRQGGLASAASIPLKVGGEFAGAISFVTSRRHVTWTEELVNRLRAIGDIFWNALKRRQAMQVLLATQLVVRESEERFRLAMSNVASGVYTLALDGIVTYMNPAAEAMFGWTNAELLGRKIHDVTHNKHPDGTPYPASECPALQVLHAGVELREHEETFIRKDGQFFPVVFSASPLRKDGTIVGIVVGFRDDTPRRDAEHAMRESEALRASEDRYRGLAEQVVDGIFITDAAGQYLDANRAACELLGYPLEELKTLKVENVVTAEERPRLSEQFGRSSNGHVVHKEWRFRRKDGSVFTGEVAGRQLQDGRLQAVVRDVSERKRREQERAEEARQKDEFLAFLGHELRNPLAAIHTAIQVLAGDTTASLRGRMEATIERQTALMRRLVDDLLELERITHGHIELEPAGLDLAECLQRAVEAVQPTVAERRQELLLRLPAEPVQFVADGTRLDQIVGNLLTNASKYTGQGGRIELSGARDGPDVVIRCKDNGQGILPGNQHAIFEPFVRGRKTNLGYGEASIGLGLALVKQLTELHGGTISVDSAGAGLGSEFTVRLPFVVPSSSQAAVAAVKPTHATRRARSVVIVEDNPSVGAALKAALEQAGHLVHLFVDAPSALAGVSGLKPEAFIIDVGLPGMDGYELASALSQQSDTKHALCIAVSGFKQRKHGWSEAFHHYFNKPVDVSALLALLDEPSTN